MQDQEQTLVEHLADLRKHLIVTLVAFVVFLVVSFIYAGPILKFFTQRIPQGVQMVALGPGEVLRVYMMIAGIAAITLTIPVALQQLWAFVAPGLTDKERKVSALFIPIIFVVFIAGLAFGYFFIFPTVYKFVMLLGTTTFELQMMQSAGSYFSFMLSIVIPFGVMFELPVLVLFLTRLGVLTPQFLTKNRKYAYFVLVVAGVVLSPPEPISDIITTLPLLLLYEIGVTLSRVAYKQRQRALQQSELA